MHNSNGLSARVSLFSVKMCVLSEHAKCTNRAGVTFNVRALGVLSWFQEEAKIF